MIADGQHRYDVDKQESGDEIFKDAELFVFHAFIIYQKISIMFNTLVNISFRDMVALWVCFRTGGPACR